MGKHPKMLYHYCSLDTFLKIITSGKIWLSDVRKSNDKQELWHLKSECAIQLLTAQNEYLERYRSREFWCRGYYVDTAGKNTSRIAEYIRNQLKEDQMGEQLTMSEVGPFTGSK